MYKGHTEDIFTLEDINVNACPECGFKGEIRMVLVDFNNRELATECAVCGQGFSLSHDKYGTRELKLMLDIVKLVREAVES